MIGKVYLDKFKKLYLDKYNIVLSDEEATDLAQHFLNLMELLIHPKTKQLEKGSNNRISDSQERIVYASQ